MARLSSGIDAAAIVRSPLPKKNDKADVYLTCDFSKPGRLANVTTAPIDVFGGMGGTADWRARIPVSGCTIDTAKTYNIKVLLDVHAVRGSQNGFDNSGISNRTEWLDENNFSHWEHAFGEWMGEWDDANSKYVSINQDNLDWAKDTV